ncbi:unnamed protein product [Thlaspi arvense]|uniref:Zinc knuckle CX2CX4HX4C domain-containing protein n=1 Tax=Thlaspi arvense TaxID=13288 RepID=A0AAU9SBV8_THLAR|nr:unnamed protein product [Thlaspi arvense]
MEVGEIGARIQVTTNADKPIQFEHIIGFLNGELLFNYEGLHRFCFNCKRLSHEQSTCPELIEDQRESLQKLRHEVNAVDPNGHTYANDSLKQARSPPTGEFRDDEYAS